MPDKKVFDSDEKIVRLAAERDARSKQAEFGDDGGGPTDMERRLAALEKGHELIIGKLGDIADDIRDQRLEIKDLRNENEKRFGSIEGRLAGIEAKLDSKASIADVREVSGRVSSIPTTWQIAAIIAALLVGLGTLSLGVSSLRQPASTPPATAPTAPSKMP